jgi:hypothetical protein
VGNPGKHLTRQRNRPIGRDADRSPAHVQLGRAAFSHSSDNQQGRDGEGRYRQPADFLGQH